MAWCPKETSRHPPETLDVYIHAPDYYFWLSMTYKGFNEFFCTWTEQKLQRSYVSPSVARGCDPRTLPSHGWRLQTHTDFLHVAWPRFVDYSMHRVIKHAPVFKTPHWHVSFLSFLHFFLSLKVARHSQKCYMGKECIDPFLGTNVHRTVSDDVCEGPLCPVTVMSYTYKN